MGLSISEATTTRALCCFPSRTARCWGTSWSSASCSCSPDFQGVIFFCTSAQWSSLFCSPERYRTNEENRMCSWSFWQSSYFMPFSQTFILLDPVSRLVIPQVRSRISQRKWRALGEICQFLKLPGWNPLIVSQIWQIWKSIKYGLEREKKKKNIR